MKIRKINSFSHLLLAFFFTLTGCVNYAGLHSNETAYDVKSLSKSQNYSLPNKKPTSTPQINASNWWLRFKDTELNQLMDVALNDSPTLNTAKDRIESSQALTEVAKSTLLPTLSFDPYINRERYTGTSYFPPPFGGAYVYQGDVPLNFAYDFDFWGKHRQQVAAAKSRSQAAAAELATARLVLSAQLTTTYYELRSHLSQMNLAQALVQKEQKEYTIVNARMAHGVESAIPLTEASAALQVAQITLENQRQLVELSRHQLAVLMGKNPLNTNIDVQPFQFSPQLIALPKNVPAHLIAKRPDIMASQWQVEASAHEIHVAKARFFPDINLTAFYSYQSIGLNNLFNENSRDILVQPALDLPLFDGGLRRADVSQKYAKYDENVSQYNQTILVALQQVGDAITRVQTTQRQLDAQNKIVRATDFNAKLVKARYQHGIVDYSEVLSTQTILLNQQLYQVQLQTAQMQNAIAMIQALGGESI
ncbi:MAG: efflux transporter outer membrane subunit [Legionellales bacterium]|nr:efflux transporter outer membrane subunit [Legionellales bacterium]